MNEPKTPNLGLNKIDRSSPSTTYFDLDKYLDQNWEKVDEGVGKVEEKAEETAAQVSSIQERLDTEKRRSVTLEPGLQIVHAERASAFKLEGLKGRTLVNLLGRDGGCESTAPFSLIYGSASPTSFVTSTTDRTEGIAGIRATWDSENTGTSRSFMIPTKLAAGKYYIAIADLSTSNVGMAAFIAVRKGDGSYHEGSRVSSIAKSLSFVSFQADGTELATGIYCGVKNLTGNIAFDSIRLYEIDTVQLNNITRMSNEMIASSYPYVNSISSVTNPYVIRYGENLLPPFYEWQRIHTNAKITGPYSLTHSKTTTGFAESSSSKALSALPNTYYHLNNGSQSALKIWFSVDGVNFPASLAIDVVNGPFKTPEDCQYILIEAYINEDKSGVFEFSNIMLNIGDTASQFKVNENSLLSLQTELHADPSSGENADQVFEREGRYFVYTKWKKEVIDQSNTYSYYNSYTGGKCVRFTFDATLGSRGIYPIMTKYNGEIITPGSPSVTINQFSIQDWNDPTRGYIGVSVPTSDSGWGDNYTPTADEIKAYFMGWKMYNWNTAGTSTYTGASGEIKAWCYRFDGVNGSTGGDFTGATQILPTTPAPNWTPYQLLYQLATPVVEPITSEGQLTLIEGSNQVEVGTGIVLRESIKPVLANSYYRFNDTTLSGTTLKNKMSKPLSMYRNSQLDYGWEFISDQYAYGTYKARKVPEGYDVSAAYTVTYLMLDTSPIAPFTGSVSENEKALLTNLVQDVQQATARISVVESKKAEKDVPAWITPTLLNGWTLSSNGAFPAQYYKDSLGFVHVNGIITGGVSNTVVFILPTGYRPKMSNRIPSIIMSGTNAFVAYLDVNASGNVIANFPTQSTHLTINISFLAEQ
ncbi:MULTISPECIES: hypothetical protein [unclassified Paenibacillus]|uniref:hypothetical protein n=1 Tax=unclassified Paenibacillus TaxID=185978 RepID=UPI000411CBA4|nr:MULTISPECIES: hypothetical protein [unclassified Paenibacillus]KGP79326.1 hypothetical protein P364_0124855 [Paenibacillus sp. MAEPY2]KGP86929.1 hypothetical protein P363_0114985 [Paenibacillus sp. MAEPY1]